MYTPILINPLKNLQSEIQVHIYKTLGDKLQIYIILLLLYFIYSSQIGNSFNMFWKLILNMNIISTFIWTFYMKGWFSLKDIKLPVCKACVYKQKPTEKYSKLYLNKIKKYLWHFSVGHKRNTSWCWAVPSSGSDGLR